MAHMDTPDGEPFREIVEIELLSLHERNFARYRIRPAEFAQWPTAWASNSARDRT
jgi:hypothetical protein